MAFKTVFNWLGLDWKRVKNHCRATDNKDFTDKDASPEFKRKLLISEHTPIRLLEIDWTWKPIEYWVSTEWSRHKFEKFISTQRDDRLIDDIPRGKKPQEAPVSYDGYANAQNLIDAWRKRMCGAATSEARELAEDFKVALHEVSPEISDVLVPNCVYRCGCSELFKPCGWFADFEKWADEYAINKAWRTNIRSRYLIYNRWFYMNYYRKRKKEMNGMVNDEAD